MPNTPLAPAPPPGPGKVQLSLSDMHSVANRFIDAQDQIGTIATTLHDALSANAQALGGDDSAKAFAKVYQPAATDAFAGFVKLHGMLGAIGKGIAVSAENHRQADEKSTPPGHPISPPFSTITPHPPIPQLDVPAIDGSTEWWMPGPLQAVWPSVTEAKAYAISAAYFTAQQAITELVDGLHNAMRAFVGSNGSADVQALDEFFGRVAGRGGNTLFTAFPDLLSRIGGSIDEYVHQVDQRANELNEAIHEAALEAGVAAVAMGILIVATEGLATLLAGSGGGAVLEGAVARISPIAARLAATIEGSEIVIATSTAAGVFTAAMAASPDPNVVTSDATQISDKLDNDLSVDNGYSRGDTDGVEQHLSRLDHSPANDAMIGRIRNAIDEGRPLTEGEQNFMKHELTEARLMDGGMSYEEAHEIALETHPLFKNYDPEVIDQFPDIFNNNWRRAWGMSPR